MKVIKDNSTQKTARVAGILFLLSLLVPVLNWGLILSKFTSPGSDTSLNILNDELLFRLNIVIGIFSAIVILTLNIYLYRLLCAVNRSLALVAFSLKMIEAILSATLFLGHFIALLVLKGDPQNIEAHKIINHLVENYISFTAVSGIFFGLSMLIYSYLFLKSGYIHLTVVLLGVVSYSLVIIYDFLAILFPCFTGILSIQILSSVPVSLFQITIGLLLSIKGIIINPIHKR